jgi:hypothetical protein
MRNLQNPPEEIGNLLVAMDGRSRLRWHDPPESPGQEPFSASCASQAMNWLRERNLRRSA